MIVLVKILRKFYRADVIAWVMLCCIDFCTQPPISIWRYVYTKVIVLLLRTYWRLKITPHIPWPIPNVCYLNNMPIQEKLLRSQTISQKAKRHLFQKEYVIVRLKGKWLLLIFEQHINILMACNNLQQVCVCYQFTVRLRTTYMMWRHHPCESSAPCN